MSQGERNEASRHNTIEQWVSLARSGNSDELGKLVIHIEAFDDLHLEACTRILLKANAQRIGDNQNLTVKTPFYGAGLALIEALFQKKEGEGLAKLAFLSWVARKESPLSIRCLDAAIDVSSVDRLYDIGHRMLSNTNPKAVECAAVLIHKLAQAGCRDAFFIAGQIFALGTGIEKDLKEAKKWFRKTALSGSSRASLELSVVPDAYLELAKLTSTPTLKNFYNHQAKVCRKAEEDLSVFVPGTEVDALVSGGENGMVEFKRCVVWDKSENLRDVAAFLNAKGGCLLIGVDDDGQPIGLKESFEAARVIDRDLYEQHIFQKLLSNYGADCSEFISVDFPLCKGQEVCRINISASSRPVYVKEGSGEENFYLRTGNSKRKLTAREAQAYCEEHFTK